MERCMLESLKKYLPYQGMKYIKPEKAGNLTETMSNLRQLAQSSRNEFTLLSQSLAERVGPFRAERVSQWMNQAQYCRPHFWCYYRLPSDHPDDVAMAIRLFGNYNHFGISVEVSFIERKRSEESLRKQNKVLSIPISSPLYYIVQKDGTSAKIEGTEENRQMLIQSVNNAQVRKVLVKKDVIYDDTQTMEQFLDKLYKACNELLPYYEVTKK